MEVTEIGRYKCSQPECSIETSGKCVNGLAIEECPNKIKIVKNLDEQIEESLLNQEPTTIRLDWGDNFSETALSFLTNQYACKLIVLIGEPYCGKSTLYAALFDSFQKGGCGNYYFHSSLTPIGFEKICHHAREKSKGKKPDTERTKLFEFAYFHLAVREKKMLESPQHLIFADINGEKFQTAKVKDDEMVKLTILKRADHIFFIADGSLLISNSERHIVKNDVWSMINRCKQNKMISDFTNVNLIITKWDEINAEGKDSEVENFFIEPTLANFNTLIHGVIKIASRSMNDEVPPRSGIDEFLNVCTMNAKNPHKEIYSPKIDREFKKFKYEQRL